VLEKKEVGGYEGTFSMGEKPKGHQKEAISQSWHYEGRDLCVPEKVKRWLLGSLTYKGRASKSGGARGQRHVKPEKNRRLGTPSSKGGGKP